LLQLLQRHDYSPEELLQQLLQGIDQAEAFYQQQIAGTELEQRLLGGGDDSSPSSSSSSSSSAAAAAAGDGPAAEGGTGEGLEAGEGVKEKPFWLDFQRQRQAYQQLVKDLEPLFALAVTGPGQAGAQLVAKIRRQLDAIQTSSSSSSKEAPAAVAAAEGEGQESEQQGGTAAAEAAGAPAADGSAQDGGGLEALRSILEGVDVSVRVAAFNQLDITRRRQLLEVLPEIRIDLNVKGTDLRWGRVPVLREGRLGGEGAGFQDERV
jgi:hypothetical protein